MLISILYSLCIFVYFPINLKLANLDTIAQGKFWLDCLPKKQSLVNFLQAIRLEYSLSCSSEEEVDTLLLFA